jgi:hypothetical protein
LLLAGVIAFTTLSVTFADSSKHSVDRAFALLLVAAQLSSPAGWIYYLWLAAGPVAALSLSNERPLLSRSSPVGWLTAVAFAGLFTPITVPYSIQRTVLATLTAGSVYFWATLVLWTCLIVDFAYRDTRRECQAL